jgi:4-diphosphocytidyl-2-C-methyl-D-erythritol kinase
MAAIAASLGSDVPVCLEPVSSWMEGRGETVSVAPKLPTLALLLVNPGVAVPTRKVFAGLRIRRGVGSVKPKGWSSAGDLIAYLEATANDLEAPACEIAPAISDAVNAIADCPDCLLARMSGSGATCFGLFESEARAEAAAHVIRAAHPAWWITPARIVS